MSHTAAIATLTQEGVPAWNCHAPGTGVLRARFDTRIFGSLASKGSHRPSTSLLHFIDPGAGRCPVGASPEVSGNAQG
jgi:hypothetical protein